MSDFVRNKVIRVKLTEDDIARLQTHYEVDDYYDIERLPQLKDLFKWDAGYLMFAPIDSKNVYLDYVLESEYGVDVGEYGKTRRLYDNEYNRFGDIFRKVIPWIVLYENNTRVVEYCWYNCSEAPEYFDETKDEFYKEIEILTVS